VFPVIETDQIQEDLSMNSMFIFYAFLPRCMQCRRGIAMRILSVRLSVCPSVRPSVRC